MSNSNFKDNIFIQRAENIKMENDKDTSYFISKEFIFWNR